MVELSMRPRVDFDEEVITIRLPKDHVLLRLYNEDIDYAEDGTFNYRLSISVANVGPSAVPQQIRREKK